ncbi:MAG: hypothetical protein D6772_07055 [Bacteroidetes bacterium]|nr:MAG: hypothetical protein D6772_07055 [Bacteroidota bacterium]
MQEFDLHSIWDDAHADAEQWYQQQRQQLLRRAQQRSEDVLRQLHRQFIRETILSLILGAGLIVWFYEASILLFWSVVLFWLACLVLVSRIYVQFRHELKQRPLQDVKTATKAYLRLLHTHGQRLVQLYRILGPLGLLLGYFAGFFQGAPARYAALQDWTFWAVSISVLVLIGWLATHYARWRYQQVIGRREKELKEVLRALEEA